MKPAPQVSSFAYNADEFRNCCGVYEVGNFVADNTKNWDAIPDDVVEHWKQVFRRENRMLVATTVDSDYVGEGSYQYGANKMLEATGWTRVSDYINPNSGNRVILWNFIP